MSYTYYQAKNQEDQVTESELPIRLSEINSRLDTLVSKTDNITRDGDKTIIPNIVIADIGIRNNGPDSGLRVSYGGQAMLNIWGSNKLVECYGALTATNITSNNKNDIEALEDKTQNIIRVPSTDEGDPSYTEIDGVGFQNTLGRISNIEFTLSNVSYDPITPCTNISGNLIVGWLNGNKIGAPSIFRYDTVTPFIPVVDSNGVIEVGNRIDFHRATNEEDYTVGLEINTLNRLSVRHTNTTFAGDLELGTTFYKNTGGICRLMSNPSSNMLWYNNAGTNTWICDATSNGERWSTTRDNALTAVTRTTGMTYTPAVVEPQPAAAYTTLTNNIYITECYANRYHTNSTSSLPINSVANVSTWGAIRIVRTGLAQNTPCGYMFGRGNDPTNMTKNLCAIYYVSPTTDISKGEIRIGIETEASTSSTNCITFDTDTKVTKFPANITAPNITGIVYNDNLLLQSTDYTTATIISNHLHVNLTGMTYKALMGIRAHKGDLATSQEMMIQLGKNHTAGISFVYKHNDTQANTEYRIDHPGRVAYRCYFGATKTEHEIRGNLKVFGTITENASKTITHYTMYEGDLLPGCFVESTGKIYRDPNSKLSPYEDCISIVKQSTEYNNNIIGVCIEILNEEVKDQYGNINQPSGKYCKYATHGDVLIKVVSATYKLGDILIPTNGGYAKKANNMEIIDAMTHMIPRLKVTSVETETIDSETVCAFITL